MSDNVPEMASKNQEPWYRPPQSYDSCMDSKKMYPNSEKLSKYLSDACPDHVASLSSWLKLLDLRDATCGSSQESGAPKMEPEARPSNYPPLDSKYNQIRTL